MNRQEVIQYQLSGIEVVEGADLAFGESSEGPCRDCGKPVDLGSTVSVNVINGDKTTVTELTEANARALLSQVGMGAPPVLCSQHEEVTLEP